MFPVKDLARAIGNAIGQPIEITETVGTAGGCINRSAIVHTRGGQRFFVKLNNAARLAMFEAEAAGLAELARADALRVPVPVCSGQAGDDAFLVLEYLELGGDMARAAEQLGHGLAALHRASAARFGWHRANTIGATPQLNDWCIDWIEFWRERRLRVQLELAAARGARQLSQLGERLLEVLPEFFHDYRPAVSLLHGDLWSGNAAATVDGTPVLFDPAVYFGDRETDVAMTELFGGFPPRFHAAYRASWPVDPGYRVRKSLYNLYHVINHFNLFGGGYLDQAERMVQRLLSARS